MPSARRNRHLATALACGVLLLGGCSPTGGRPPGEPRTDGLGATSGAGGFALEAGDGFASTTAFDAASTCDDPGDLSPGLVFDHVPDGTAELALTMVDTDTSTGRDTVHWIQVSIPADTEGLRQHRLLAGARELTNDFGEATYDGPCPPPGPPHHYTLTLYALAHPVTVGTVGTVVTVGTASDPHAVVDALRAQSSATATLTVTYARG